MPLSNQRRGGQGWPQGLPTVPWFSGIWRVDLEEGMPLLAVGWGAAGSKWGSGRGQRESEEGVLDLELVGVWFDKVCKGEISEGPPWAWGVVPLDVG